MCNRLVKNAERSDTIGTPKRIVGVSALTSHPPNTQHVMVKPTDRLNTRIRTGSNRPAPNRPIKPQRTPLRLFTPIAVHYLAKRLRLDGDGVRFFFFLLTAFFLPYTPHDLLMEYHHHPENCKRKRLWRCLVGLCVKFILAIQQ